MQLWFSQTARALSSAAGTWQAFSLALSAVLIWVVAGFFVGFDNQLYQLTINTGTTIITFLMVFLLQAAQNHDAAAVQLKLAELIRANEQARNQLISVEDLTNEQMSELKAKFTELAEKDA
jgi:low affinity Fe/Cu permease